MQKSNVQQKDDLKDELKDELTVEFKEKDDFLLNFSIEDLELTKIFHIFASSKDIHIHSFTLIHSHQSSVFREYEIFITKGRVQ